MQGLEIQTVELRDSGGPSMLAVLSIRSPAMNVQMAVSPSAMAAPTTATSVAQSDLAQVTWSLTELALPVPESHDAWHSVTPVLSCFLVFRM